VHKGVVSEASLLLGPGAASGASESSAEPWPSAGRSWKTKLTVGARCQRRRERGEAPDTRVGRSAG